MKKKRSPCIDVCEFSGPKGWCVGCGRTKQECRDWKKLKPYDQAIIEKSLKKRLIQMIKK